MINVYCLITFLAQIPVQEIVNGVFSQIERLVVTGSKTIMKLTQIKGWKNKVIDWIREQNIDGKKLSKTATKELSKMLRLKLVPNDEKASKKLNGPCGKIIFICKRIPIHKVLVAAAAGTQSMCLIYSHQ